MPLIHFDLLKGRSVEEIQKILAVSHRVFVKTLGLPEGDRYQIVHQHEPYEMEIEDTGLGFERTKGMVIISVFTKERSQNQKIDLYRELVVALEQECNIVPSDVMISFQSNKKEDWSFGFGRAQFLTEELQ